MPYQLKTHIHNYVGDSSDNKPTTDIPIGSVFYETDTTITYMWEGRDWTPTSIVSVQYEQRIINDTANDLLERILNELLEMNIHMRTLTDESFERIT